MNASGLNQGTSGNVSVRFGDAILVTPSGVPYERMEPGDIVRLAMDGSFRARGARVPSSEWRFHRDILCARPEFGAVVHAHPSFCTTLAILRRDIPPLHYMIAAAGGETIRCAPYATYGTEALSRHALAALEGRSACLLANHGMIAAGATLERAMWLATEVEALAQQYVRCLQLGGPVLLEGGEIARVLERFAGYGLREEP